MPGGQSLSRYTNTAVVLHWLVAVAVTAQFAFGWLMQQIPKSPSGVRADAFNLHKSIGLCLLALALFRLGWRLGHRPPPFPVMAKWRERAARGTHAALYGALIVMPLTGYLGSAWSGYPVKWFGVVLPTWATSVPALKALMSAIHLATSYALLSLVVLHVAGALEHWRRSDGVLARMSLRRTGGKRRSAAVPPAVTEP